MRAPRGLILLVSLATGMSSVGLVAPEACAFVSPGYHASRARNTLVGRWRIVGNRKGGVAEDIDPSVRIDITTATMHRSVGGVADPNYGHYEVLHEDDSSLELQVVFDDQVLAIDVLVEGSDAVTLYIRSEHDDDEERAVRLDRVAE